MNRVILFVAQGFGSGWAPVAPGTFGSVVGVLWFWVLMLTGSPVLFGIGAVAGIFVSAWLCGAAEKILQRKDPGSVVLDEIIAIPICFFTPLIFAAKQQHSWPSAATFFSGKGWWITLAAFLLFRVFDVLKPWPVKQSQNLRGGWGVTIDDVLAAVYVNVCFVVYYSLSGKLIG